MRDIGSILYCACDDSNNKGKVGHEIILATFSFWKGDNVYNDFKNRRNCRSGDRERIFFDSKRWMKDNIRDYRFAAITHDELSDELDIPWVLPFLINGYLKKCPYVVDDIRVYIDGPFGDGGEKKILDGVPNFPNMKVKSIIKKSIGRKKRKPRMLHFPKILWGADIWANIVYNQGVESNIRDPRRIIIE